MITWTLLIRRCAIPLTLFVTMLLCGCQTQNSGGHDHGHGAHQEHRDDHSDHAKEEEDHTLARTEFSDNLLNFFEFKALAPGQASSFLIHLTDLRDGSPVAQAEVHLDIWKSSARVGSVQAKVGRVTGIYVAEVKIQAEGNYRIDFRVKNDKIDETMRLENFLVATHHPEPGPEENSAAQTVAFLMEQQWTVGMTLSQVSKSERNRALTASGRVVPEPHRHAVLSSPVRGSIEAGFVPRVGRRVSQGEPLILLSQTPSSVDQAQLQASAIQAQAAQFQTSAQLKHQNAQARIENARLAAEKKALSGKLSVARSKFEQAGKEAERARKVFAIEGISEKDLRAVELQFETAGAEYRAIQANQKALSQVPELPLSPLPPELPSGLTGSGNLRLPSPLTGVVTKVHKAPGEQVDAGEPILEVSNLDTVWLRSSVFERDLGRLDEGMEATFTVLSYPEREFTGSLVNVSPVVEEHSRAVEVLFAVPNPDHALKLGMQAQVRLAAREQVSTLVIPSEALIERDGAQFVYVLLTGEEFERRRVTVAENFGSTVGVSDGLSPGERVVVKGAYQLFLQETAPANPVPHSHEV